MSFDRYDGAGVVDAFRPPVETRGVAAATEVELRRSGLSAAKVQALRAFALAVASVGLDLARLGNLDAEEACREIVAVRGVSPGRRTTVSSSSSVIQMRFGPAIWPFRSGKISPRSESPTRRKERWRPWRAVAGCMLWPYYRGTKNRSGVVLADASG